MSRGAGKKSIKHAIIQTLFHRGFRIRADDDDDGWPNHWRGERRGRKKSFHPHSFINFVCVVIAPVRVISAFAHSYFFNLITSNQTEVMGNKQTTEVEKKTFGHNKTTFRRQKMSSWQTEKNKNTILHIL